MEVDKIKELIEMMKTNDLSELEIVDGDSRVVLKRGQEVVVQATPAIAAAPVVSANAAVQADAAPIAAGVESDSYLKITSPVVGTYYAAPSPKAGVFVKVGDTVTEDSVVCIIEAMKVMNEVKSQVSGTIKKILVADGAAVEYGQEMFLVEPN